MSNGRMTMTNKLVRMLREAAIIYFIYLNRLKKNITSGKHFDLIAIMDDHSS
jgi:hypothetical protein